MLTAEQMRALAQIARAGDGLIRPATAHTAVLGFMSEATLDRAFGALRQAGLGATAACDIACCPGAETCALALTRTTDLAAQLRRLVDACPGARDLTVRVCGCPNACGHHWIADIGLYGNLRKEDGRAVPYYQLLLGGGPDGNGGLRFAAPVRAIPARLVPEAVERVLAQYAGCREDAETFRSYVRRASFETFRELTADLARSSDNEAEEIVEAGQSECGA